MLARQFAFQILELLSHLMLIAVAPETLIGCKIQATKMKAHEISHRCTCSLFHSERCEFSKPVSPSGTPVGFLHHNVKLVAK